jgi:hypothetical protein
MKAILISALDEGEWQAPILLITIPEWTALEPKSDLRGEKPYEFWKSLSSEEAHLWKLLDLQ